MTRQRERNLLKLENDLRRKRRRAKTRPDQTPVGPRTFVESAQYLNAKGELYPGVLDAFIELNSGGFEEGVLTGGIGTGKATPAVYTTAYQIYRLSCLHSPQKEFGLSPKSKISFVFQSLTENHAQSVGFDQVREVIRQAPYFRARFRPVRVTSSEIAFEKGLLVKAISGQPTAAIGQNMIGGVIDEVNFMQTVDRSTRSPDGRIFDQAQAAYEAIQRRRESRFRRKGRLSGILCIGPSRRYPNQFTDQKERQVREQIERFGRSRIYIYDKRVWEVKLLGTFSDRTFPVFLGDETRAPTVLKPSEVTALGDQDLVLQVPVNFRDEFERDLNAALRDIAGIATYAVRPYFANQKAVLACFGRTDQILSRESFDFESATLTLHKRKISNPDLIRWVHLDLILTGDGTGIVVGHVARFVPLERGETVETLPIIRIDFCLQVVPPRNGEICYEYIRGLFYFLREQGLNIQFVAADSFQSVDTLQQLRFRSFRTDLRSPDREPHIYESLKSTIYDSRLELPEYPVLRQELLSLERDPKTGKAEHPVHGSKDLADALATVVYSLKNQRVVWDQHRVIPRRQAPALIGKHQIMSRESEERSRRNIESVFRG